MAPCTTLCLRRSNVIAINTPGTQAFGGSITMVYDYNRLSKKRMPNSLGTDLYDVDYTYGSFNDGRNGAGRITVITQGGNFKSDSYRYDELGQRIEEDVTVDVPVYGFRDFNTKKYFDSFGRILQAVYPDGDQVDYDYNLLGELNTIKSKVAGVSQDIVSAISYNGFGQISQLTYGNGTITDYSYATGNTNKATTLMGSTVLAKEQGASVQTPILSRDYTYNKQGMVRKMIRNVAGSLLSQFSNATFTDTYAYDRFGRLDGHEQLDGSSSIYTLDMDYNKAGSITFKNGNGSSFMNATALTYGLEYNYDPSKDHQLDHIWDPASGTNTTFTYNTSGSVTRINDPSQAIPQDFFWNEQQQLTGVKNQQGVHHYVYDHQGERLMKSSLISTSVYLNDQVIDNVTNLDPYTVYVNPFYVVTGLLGGDRVSKHYYMNQQRVATDITINYDPNGGGGGEYAPSKGLDDLKKIVQELSHEPLDTSILALPSLTDYYPETAKAKSSNSQAEGSGSSGRILFWYHPDYLGNVDLVTEIDGFAHEFFIYNPWGEEMHQWNANTYAFTSPYRFNSKELDPETGLAYYGARYYQNKIGMWLSVDPLAHETFKPFVFTGNNPIILLDPDGREVILTGPLAPATFATLSNRAQSEGVILSMSNDGTLSYNYSGDNMQLSNSMRTLLNGIDNKNINVNVISKNSNITSSGGASHGGAFSGNTFTEIESGESFLREINANSPLGSESFTTPNLNRVDAIQDINPNLLNAVDVVRNTPGQLIMHEITEAIVGAEMSLALKRSAPPATKGNENFIYNSAHNSNRTEPQGPDLDTLITFRVYQDANNNIMVEHKVIDYNKNVIYILVDQY